MKAARVLPRRDMLAMGAWGLLVQSAANAAPVGATPGGASPRVTLLDHAGREWFLPDLMRHGPLLVSFFFTGCSTICPPQTALLRDLQEELARRSRPERPLIVSISLDPFGDSPAAVKRYAATFEIELGPDHGWMMLTGPRAALLPVWSAFGAPRDRPEEHAETFWLRGSAAAKWRRIGAYSQASQIANLFDG